MTTDLIRPARMIAVWCPDWPVVAARHSATGSAAGSATASVTGTTDEPIAVITANLVVACSHPARVSGVRRGMRRREAQSRCPDLVVLPRDEIGEARAFEPVVTAIESIAPGVEITRPGLAAIGAQGPTRYFGGETAVVHALSRRLSQLNSPSPDEIANASHPSTAGQADGHPIGLPIGDVLIGVADGSFAAEHAARRGVLIPAGQSAPFLADLPIETIDEPELVDLLRRLGIRTLGAFADLPARDVLARFGPGGAWVHRQCGGRDARPIATRRPAAEHSVDIVFEPALDRVDAIAFSARTGAERFIDGLVAHGLACTCLELIAQTDNGEETVRSWRQSGVLTSVDVIDRIRWQLEGWLNGGYSTDRRSVGGPDRPTAGVTLLRLVAVQVVPIGAHQQSLWSGAGADDERAHRALARVQTLLGHGSVLTAVVDGGRNPAERTRLVPWGDDRGRDDQGRANEQGRAEHGRAEHGRAEQGRAGQGRAGQGRGEREVPAPPRPVADSSSRPPWPGHIPAPAPSVLIDPPRAVQVLDAGGRCVTVTARGAVPTPPTRLIVGTGTPVAITAWAGPWPVDDNWWNRPRPGDGTPQQGLRRRARFQLVDVHGRAYLVTCSVPLSAAGGAVETAQPPADPAAVDPDVTAQWTLDALYD